MSFAVYAATLRPGIDFWDTGDLQTVPYILGIPYPTGYPGYVLLGWVWTHALPVGEVAWRMNLLSAAALAVAAGATAAAIATLGAEPEIAAVGAGLAAVAHPVWQMANHAEVHGVATAAVLVALAFAVRWWRTGAARAPTACAVAAGIAVAIDAASALSLAGVALVALARPVAPRRAAALLGLALVLAAAAYAYLPVRSAEVTAARIDPTLALGLPPGRPFWDDHHPATWDGFLSEVTGSEFGVGRALGALVAPSTLLRLARVWYPPARRDFAYGSFAFAVVGFGFALRRDWRVALGFLATPAIPTLFALAYREEAQIERYYVIGDFIIAGLLAYGVDRLLRLVDDGPRRIAALLAAGLLAGVGAHEISVAADVIAQHGDRSGRAWIDRVVATSDPRSIVVAAWARATPLAYASYVDHTLGERIVVTAWPGDVADRLAAWRRRWPVVLVIEDPKLPAALAALHLRRLDAAEPALYEVLP